MTLERAVAHAAIAHEGQERASGRPYIVHPLRVMLAVSEDAREAAVLHDVLEDTDAGLPDDLDPVTVEAVEALTRDPGQPYGEYIEALASWPGKAGKVAREVKTADLRDNLMSDPGLMSVGRLIKLRKRYLRALTLLDEAASEPRQQCKFCGSVYAYGECCPDCLKQCKCPWELGLGRNVKCPIHGFMEYRLPLYKGTH